MAITIDYSTFTINVPRADMLLVQSSPVEVRQLDINSFRTTLNALMASEEGIPFLTNHIHTAPFTISGVTLARVVEILAPYTITFEDGAYNVNITGGNSNISDRTNKNTVGVNTANSAGLQDPFALQAGAYNDEIVIDPINGTDGDQFPIGTRGTPALTLANVASISASRGYTAVRVIGQLVVLPGQDISSYQIRGDTPSKSIIVLVSGCVTDGVSFNRNFVTGTLDGGNATFLESAFANVVNFNGLAFNCLLRGAVTVAENGAVAIAQCQSDVEDGVAVPFDFTGVTDASVRFGLHAGALEFTNVTGAGVDITLDMASGEITVNNTNTAGLLTARGLSTVNDTTAGMTVIDRTDSFAAQSAAFAGEVILDPINGQAGTDFPIGTLGAPSDNLTDAKAIGAERGYRAIRVVGTLVVGASDDVSNLQIRGYSPSQSIIVLSPGATTTGVSFSRNFVTGALDGGDCSMLECAAAGVVNANGLFFNSVLRGTITPADNADITVAQCQSDLPSAAAVPFDFANVATAASVRFGLHSGAISIENMTNASTDVTLDMASGEVFVDNTNTDGLVTVRGLSTVNDTNGGTEVIDRTDSFATQAAALGGEVSLDPINGVAGTGFPIGTLRQPSNNLTDAKAIALERGYTAIRVIGTLVVGASDDISNLQIRGNSPSQSIIVLSAGCTTAGVSFNRNFVTGVLDGGDCSMLECGAQNVVNANGLMYNTLLRGAIFPADNSDMTVAICQSDLPNAAAVPFDFANVATASSVRFGSHAGAVTLRNMTVAGADVTLDMTAGEVAVEASCTDGLVTVRGLATLTDNNAGTTVIDRTDSFAAQSGAYNGIITFEDTGDDSLGDTFPAGTEKNPAGTFAQAKSIADLRGFRTIRIRGSATLASVDFSAGFTFVGDSVNTDTLVVAASANVANCTFNELTLSGALDGGASVHDCTIGSVTGFEGEAISSSLVGPVVLAAAGQADFAYCYSAVAGGGPGQTPTLDFNGGQCDLTLRQYSGGLAITGSTDAAVDASYDLVGGRVLFDNTNTAGAHSVRGVALIQDDSAGATVKDQTTSQPEQAVVQQWITTTTSAAALITIKRNEKDLVEPGATLDVIAYRDDATTLFSVSGITPDANGVYSVSQAGLTGLAAGDQITVKVTADTSDISTVAAEVVTIAGGSGFTTSDRTVLDKVSKSTSLIPALL